VVRRWRTQFRPRFCDKCHPLIKPSQISRLRIRSHFRGSLVVRSRGRFRTTSPFDLAKRRAAGALNAVDALPQCGRNRLKTQLLRDPRPSEAATPPAPSLRRTQGDLPSEVDCSHSSSHRVVTPSAAAKIGTTTEMAQNGHDGDHIVVTMTATVTKRDARKQRRRHARNTKEAEPRALKSVILPSTSIDSIIGK